MIPIWFYGIIGVIVVGVIVWTFSKFGHIGDDFYERY
jgi:hypothetical protein